MTFIGTDQHHDIDEILKRARKFLADGHRVQIARVEFSGERGHEHPHPFEFELYVDFESVDIEACSNCGTKLAKIGKNSFCPKCEPPIVDAPSAGFYVCPECGNHSLREDGWCGNGCYNDVTYRGYIITRKKDFGNKPFLIDGYEVRSGWIVTKNDVNVVDGAGWFRTLDKARKHIDFLWSWHHIKKEMDLK